MKHCILRGAAAILLLYGLSVGNVVAESIECKTPISQKICYTLGGDTRECIDPPTELTHYKLGEQIELIYSIAPPTMQRAMCALDHLFISEEIHEHAAGIQLATEIHLSWYAIHLFHESMESFIEGEFSRYATGATFAGLEKGYDPQDLRLTDAHLLRYEVAYTKGRIEGLNYPLAYLLFHELAHFLEKHPRFNNHHSFGYFSCNSQYQAANNYRLHALDRRIKGYAMVLDQHPKIGQDSAILQELEDDNYATFYALANAGEDFAELVAEYIMHQHLGVNYRVMKGDEVLFERAKQFKNNKIQPKLEVVKLALAFPEMSRKQKREVRKDRRLCRGVFDPRLMTVLP
ncbi:putative zinc-binding metallopeptidase [Maritalea porphyrae]|uniref:Uncharacterized protein n=1 Tax=Maritalea porphyrae TaxID=880732 RepID=A0ABQ5ULR2_9HYPH|nr:putative zinc-binding metallopeptidase [Maritalea porphyrae]GLQ16198.1 hypothetical protein GCM10007879_04470 [Maritalea porphyrae]